MKEQFIQLNKTNILRLGIIDELGNDTGEVLTFDLEDIELPLRYQELIESDKRNRQQLKNQLIIIQKRQDVKGKKLMSKNEEDRIRAINDFLKKQEKVYDMFLGENGVKKLLNGRKLTWLTFEEIDEIIDKQIAPYLEKNMETISDKIINKYGNAPASYEEVLK